MLVLVFKQIESEDKTKYNTFYSHSKAETVVSESDIGDGFNTFTADNVLCRHVSRNTKLYLVSRPVLKIASY